jgi:hypothetical protein
MPAADLKVASKRNKIHSACNVLLNILKHSKVQDANQDILNSSSLPTLLIQMLKNVQKTKNQENGDLVADLVNCISELSKISFTR